jgi:predicted nucleic acid-binding protein
MIVVDASVAAKWYMSEAESPLAAALLAGRDRLAAPDILRHEVASAILRKQRRGGLTGADALRLVDEWIADLDTGEIDLQPWRTDFRDAAAIARAILHPFVDCLYIACARRLRATLVTADAALLRRGVAAYAAIRAL